MYIGKRITSVARDARDANLLGCPEMAKNNSNQLHSIKSQSHKSNLY